MLKKAKAKLQGLLLVTSLSVSQWVMASPVSGNEKPTTMLTAVLAIVFTVATLILTIVTAYEGINVVVTKEFSLKKIGIIVAGAILTFGAGYFASKLIGQAL